MSSNFKDSKLVGENIKKLRQAKGFSLEVMSAIIGITKEELMEIESGDLELPSEREIASTYLNKTVQNKKTGTKAKVIYMMEAKEHGIAFILDPEKGNFVEVMLDQFQHDWQIIK